MPRHLAVRAGDWKIISHDENAPWELYNLAADGTETTNLATQHPDVVKELAAKWRRWARSFTADQ